MKCVLCMVLSVCLLPSEAPAAAEERVFAEDFGGSQDARWRIDGNVWTFRDGAGRRGSRAIVYERNERNATVSCDSPHVELPACPLEALRITGYFRGRSDGARKPLLRLECIDANGRRLRGGEAQIVQDNAVVGLGIGKSDFEWHRLEAVTPFLPREVAKCFLSVRFPGDFRETAAFDDIAVSRVALPPVSVLYSSAYRDRESEGPVDFVTECFCKPGAHVRGELVYRGAGGTSVRKAVSPDGKGVVRVTVDVEDMAPGANDVVFDLYGSGNVRLGSVTNRFVRGRKGERRPRVHTDRHGRTIVDGRPFFPIGLEAPSLPDGELLERYAAGPFNCIRTPPAASVELLDKYYARGILWIVSMQDHYFNVKRAAGGARFKSQQEVWDELGKIVGLYKDHPVTLAWLTNDELPIGNVPEAEATYRFFRERDPDHPVRCVIDQPQNIRAFLGTCDNASTDPYPIGNWRKPPIGFAGEATRITREQSFGIRSMWQVVQAFDWKWYRRGESPERLADWGVRMPTADEMRSMSWQCIAEGSNGLLWYSYKSYHRFCQTQAEKEKWWLDVSTVASEVRRFADMMLSAEPAPAARSDNPKVLTRVWRHAGAVWLLACNAERTEQRAKVSFRGATFAKGVPALGTSPVAVRGSDVVLDLGPIAVSIVRLSEP